MQAQWPPAYPPLDATAFFFDFDGTLVELAATPDSVIVPPLIPDLLTELRHLTHGAVALVSGRTLHSLDSLMGTLNLPMVGLHGAERRSANGANVVRIGFDDPRLPRIGQQLEAVAAAHPGMLLETKGAGFALHYRNAQHCEALVSEVMQRLILDCQDAYTLQQGKMLYEIKPKNVDKGRAIRAFLDEPPFSGRVPFFAGDDLTDESAFAAVNECGGLSIKVGAGPTVARARAESVTALTEWLCSVAGLS